MKSNTRVYLSGRRPLGPRARATLKRLLTNVMEGHKAAGALSVVFVGDDEIRGLQREFLGTDQATDVISFPLRDPDDPAHDELLGEIAVSVETARREAERRDLPLERELTLYALHGLLHLLGYDDLEPAARRRMRRAERKYLAAFGYG